jgi:hypothetical protein
MMLRYAVGMKIRNKADQMTVEAEDALIAALKVKTAHPKPRSPMCASKTPVEIDAIRTRRTRTKTLQWLVLSQGHLITDSHRSSPCAASAGTVQHGDLRRISCALAFVSR